MPTSLQPAPAHCPAQSPDLRWSASKLPLIAVSNMHELPEFLPTRLALEGDRVPRSVTSTENQTMEDAIIKALRSIIREEIEAAFKRHQAAPPKNVQRERQSTPQPAPSTLCTRCERPNRLDQFHGHEPLWGTAQVAVFLGLSRKTVLNRVSMGKFPQPIKNGRLNAFKPADVVAYRRELLGLDD